jgi:hypothetical protein
VKIISEHFDPSFRHCVEIPLRIGDKTGRCEPDQVLDRKRLAALVIDIALENLGGAETPDADESGNAARSFQCGSDRIAEFFKIGPVV